MASPLLGISLLSVGLITSVVGATTCYKNTTPTQTACQLMGITATTPPTNPADCYSVIDSDGDCNSVTTEDGTRQGVIQYERTCRYWTYIPNVTGCTQDDLKETVKECEKQNAIGCPGGPPS